MVVEVVCRSSVLGVQNVVGEACVRRKSLGPGRFVFLGAQLQKKKMGAGMSSRSVERPAAAVPSASGGERDFGAPSESSWMCGNCYDQ